MGSPRLDSLRAALTAMPPGTLVPRDWVLERLSEDIPDVPAAVTPATPTRVDLAIRDVAQLFGKQPSTVRAWVERGDFPGAYKLHGKEWRVPVSGVEAFQNWQRRRTAKSEARLSAWRTVGHVKATAQSETGQQQVTKRSVRGKAQGCPRCRNELRNNVQMGLA